LIHLDTSVVLALSVRTLDALHVTAIEYLRAQRLGVELATYDERMASAARRLRIPLVRLRR